MMETCGSFSPHRENLRFLRLNRFMDTFCGALKSDRRFFYIQTHRQFCTVPRFLEAEMSAVSASVYANIRKRERQEGGTAHGVAVTLTDRVEESLQFSKGVCLSFVQTETTGYHSLMQSLTTKGKLIAWPSSDKLQREKEPRERRKGESCIVVRVH